MLNTNLVNTIIIPYPKMKLTSIKINSIIVCGQSRLILKLSVVNSEFLEIHFNIFFFAKFIFA